MATKGQVRFRAVRRMLRRCAEGHQVREVEHHKVISWKGKEYRTFPKGPGQHQDNFLVEIGHVKALVRRLGINPDCARAAIPALRNRL